MSRVAFMKAERARRFRKPASARQRQEVIRLSRMADIEPPRIYWSRDASDAISRLERIVREPTLGPMG